MTAPSTLPCDVLPCPSGDVILIPRGQLAIRLNPEQQRELADRFPALNGLDLSV